MNADELKNFFFSHKIPQTQIADDLGVSFAYVNSILNGRKQIGRKTAQKLADLYGISFTWLMTGEGSIVAGHDPAPEAPAAPAAAPSEEDPGLEEMYRVTCAENADLRIRLAKALKYIADLEDRIKSC